MTHPDSLKEYYVDQIANRGYVTAAFEIGPLDTFRLFTNLDEVFGEVFDNPSPSGVHIIKSLAVGLHGRDDNSQGFIDRRRVGEVSAYEIERGPGTEDKDLLHFTPYTLENATAYFGGLQRMPSLLKSLLEYCQTYYEAVQTGMSPVLEALGLKPYLIAPHGYRNVHINRFISYPAIAETETAPQLIMPGQQLGNRAELHFDRGRMTAATAEDTEGLVGTQGNNLTGRPNLRVDEIDEMATRAIATSIKHEARRMKIFAAAGYNHIPAPIIEESGNIDLLLHGAINLIPNTVRHAAVTFINEHSGIIGWPTPGKHETGFGKFRTFAAERERRYGSMEDA